MNNNKYALYDAITSFCRHDGFDIKEYTITATPHTTSTNTGIDKRTTTITLI